MSNVAPTIEPMALTIDDAVKASTLSRTTIYGAIKRGEIIARKSGTRTVILAADLHCWLGRLPPDAVNRG